MSPPNSHIPPKANPGAFEANDSCADFLNSIGSLYRECNEPYRATAFETASDIIRCHPENILIRNNFQNIDGVGKSINQEIKEFLETGTSNRFERLTKVVGN